MYFGLCPSRSTAHRTCPAFHCFTSCPQSQYGPLNFHSRIDRFLPSKLSSSLLPQLKNSLSDIYEVLCQVLQMWNKIRQRLFPQAACNPAERKIQNLPNTLHPTTIGGEEKSWNSMLKRQSVKRKPPLLYLWKNFYYFETFLYFASNNIQICAHTYVVRGGWLASMFILCH